jgi:altronate hydrolase
VIVVGLGCEGMQIARLMHNEGLEAGTYLRTLTIQETGGIRKTIEEAVNKATDLLKEANRAQREPIPISEITVALQCGGSDSYSGITANPALGYATDLLIQKGGTAILAETPEIYGAEHLLTQRAQSPEIAQKLLSKIQWWEEYTRKNDSSMDNNPSPGNKAGGLTTILEKSLGAVAKGGSTNLCGVFDYGERITTKGLVFMDSPGYDPASVTGEVAGGANIICFTTGRGSVFGSKPVPSIKLATNSTMYNFMEEDMDINCGDIIEGSATIESKGKEIFDAIIQTASGTKTKSEQFGLGDFEFIPWQVGVVM